MPRRRTRGQTLQRLLELKAQAQTNLRRASRISTQPIRLWRTSRTLLNEVRGLAVEAASDTSTDAMRQAAAEEVGRAIEQLLNTGNQSFRGRYLFAGSRSTESPFMQDDSGIAYLGNEGSLDSFVDLDLPYATNASGAEVFGSFSAEVQGTVDLNPRLTATRPWPSLYGGRGVTLGSMEIGDGTTKKIIDLTSAATIGDVADLIESQSAGRPHDDGDDHGDRLDD